MKEKILAKLEASRKDLLDFSTRNPLIHYRGSKQRGVHVVNEKPESVYELLVRQLKAMAFTGKAEKAEGSQVALFNELSAEQQKSLQADLKLQTNESEKSLQTRLLNTYYAARTSIEEQGVNILFLAMGMLHWYEDESSDELRKAPLLLVPMEMERGSASEKFKIKYSEEDTGGNISLQAKMKAEFNLKLPDLPEAEDLDIARYFNDIAKAVKSQKRWSVEPDAIELGFFSFGKFMIYNDLDSSKWPANKNPAEHPILGNLLETGFSEPSLSYDDDSFIDTETKADDLFQVVDADSSQILSMLAVHDGRNMVIQGPPGTGKSQTITNIIANAIGQGKKVLFVAEKMAALEVVKRRLDSIQLGEACLELHSHKANKKELLAELKRILELGKPRTEQLSQKVSLLGDLKNELNAYCIAVNTEIGKSGLTAHKVMGKLLHIQEATQSVKMPRITIPDVAEWEQQNFLKAIHFSERIEARIREIGTPEQLHFWGIGLTVLLPAEEETVYELLLDTKEKAEALDAISLKVSSYLKIPAVAMMEDIDKLIAISQFLSKSPDLTDLPIEHKKWLYSEAEIKELIDKGKELNKIHQQYDHVIQEDAWQASVAEIKQNFLENGEKWYRNFIGSYRKNKKRFKTLMKTDFPKELSLQIEYLDAIIKAQNLEEAIKVEELTGKELFNYYWKGKSSSWETLDAVFFFVNQLQHGVKNGFYPSQIFEVFKNGFDAKINGQHAEQLTASQIAYKLKRLEVVEKLQFDIHRKFAVTAFDQVLFNDQLSLLRSWVSNLPEIQKMISWNILEETARDEHFLFLTAFAAKWDLSGNYLRLALERSWYEYLYEEAVRNFAPIRKFQGNSHEELVKQFVEADKINFAFKRASAAFKHWEGLPQSNAGGQVNVLRTEFNKKARHMPIRKLVKEAGLAIQAVKPVFMMSPMSIANFIPPDSIDFDLVIFDEASQVKPVDALGAILRAKQVVVVGDSKQLPPTSFFDSLTDDGDDDEENVTADMQSILGLCDAQGAPQRMLRWHYRSKHESLISVSNHEFYENRLVIFPSPGAKGKLGLIHHHLKNTAYDRGKTRTNPLEAAAVAEAVIEHARKHPELSLGVVAFSNSQRKAIEDAVEEKRKANPDIESFFNAKPNEPFFIKNLENVQGDERDVIFISIGYGKTEDGYLSMSFGPLNNDGGERRLNVLITRAKLRCEVFTNLTADDIDLNLSNKLGVRALKSFLHFAQHGKLYTTHETGKEADSPFEEAVERALEKHGYIVHRQVGSIGFFIDLTIVDPENPGRYLLGIECDGASYHSSRSARDRDRLRQQVLEGMGWRIHRVWSTDWFKYPDRELKKIIEAIEKAKIVLTTDDEIEKEIIVEHSIQREEVEQVQDAVNYYQKANLPKSLNGQELHLVPTGKLASFVQKVVEVESPVHHEEVARRITDAAGLSRVGNRIVEAVSAAINHCKNEKTVVVKKGFIWRADMQEPTVRNRQALTGNLKKILYVAPEEIAVSILKNVRQSIAISEDSCILLVAKELGFMRTTEEIQYGISLVIKDLIKNRRIEKDGDLLKVV